MEYIMLSLCIIAGIALGIIGSNYLLWKIVTNKNFIVNAMVKYIDIAFDCMDTIFTKTNFKKMEERLEKISNNLEEQSSEDLEN